MCTKILLDQIERMKWNGKNALVGDEFVLSFVAKPWTKGLAVELWLTKPQPSKFERSTTIVLRRDGRLKLIREMVRVWARKESRERHSWIDKRIGKDARVGPNVQQFVNAVFSKYMDASDVAKERAMDALRKSVRRAQEAGLTQDDVQAAWDEGLLAQMLQS